MWVEAIVKVPIYSRLHAHAQNQSAQLPVAATQLFVLLMWVEVPDSSPR